MEFIPELDNNEIEEIHKHYEERLALYRKKGVDLQKSRKFILDTMRPLEGNILEIGAGTGYTALSLATAGYTFTAIDTDKEALKTTASMLAYEKVLSNAKLHLMDAAHTDFPNESFHNVIAINLLHHVGEVDKVLSEADRVLCKGGKLVVSEFNKKGREVISSAHKEEGRTHDHPAVDWEYISSYLKQKGYEVKKSDDAFHWILIAVKK